jgi:hypothetical protein
MSSHLSNWVHLLTNGRPLPVVYDEPAPEPQPKVRPKKCEQNGCTKKLALTDFACKCKQYYCSSHRFSDSHSCTFDYKGVGKELLEKQLLEVKGSRLEKI